MADRNEGLERGAEAEAPTLRNRRIFVRCTGKIADVLGKWKPKHPTPLSKKICVLLATCFLIWMCCFFGKNCKEHMTALIIKGVLSFIFACGWTIVDCSSPFFWQFLKNIIIFTFPLIVEAKRDKKNHDQSIEISNGICRNEADEIVMTAEGYAILLEYFTCQLSYRVEDVIKTVINFIVACAICYIYGQCVCCKTLELKTLLNLGPLGWTIYNLIVAVWEYKKTTKYKAAIEQMGLFQSRG